MRFHKSVFQQALLLLLILASCRTAVEQAAPSPTPLPAPTTTEQVAVLAATITTTTASPATPDPWPPTPANAATAFPGDRDEALIPLPGIVFENDEGTWLVEADSGARLLTAYTGVEVSPDGEQGLICIDGDVVLLDFASGAEVNLTGGSGRVHYSATWWPARSGTLVLTSVSPEEEGPVAGRLTLVETDGSDYRVVQTEGEIGYAFPAPAPDGQTIAFDGALRGMLYHVDGAVEPFNPSDYSLPPEVEVVRMGSPAWSPDGKWLAWMLGLRGGPYGQGEVWDGVLGVFHPESHSVTLIHPFRPAGRGGWFRPPVWSTDGRWLAFDVESVVPAENGLWVTDPFGLVTRRLRPGAGYPVVWSPPGDEHWTNGNTLVIARPGWRAMEDNWLLVSGGWKETALVLPGAVVDWLPPAAMAEVPAPPVLSETAPPPAEGHFPSSTLTQPPPGLLAALGSMDHGWALVLAEDDGSLRTLVEQIAPPGQLPDFDVSPDGRQLLYVSAGDIWLLDISSGSSENVTNTRDRSERVPRWWLQRGLATAFVCGSRPAEMGPGPALGYLTVVGLDGNYEVLVEEGQLAAPPAPRPDGRTIAYSRAHEDRAQPFLYELDVGETVLDLAEYGLEWVSQSWEPSWPPAGRQLAWSVSGNRDSVYHGAQVLLNLEEEGHTLLHTYRPQPTGDYLPALRWAPDGSWVTFLALATTRTDAGLWWLPPESEMVVQLSPTFIRPSTVSHPAVSPDGAWIAVPTYDGSAVGLVDTASQEVLTWTVPGEVAAVAWTNSVGREFMNPSP